MTIYHLYWIRDDREGSVAMGEYGTLDDALSAHPVADETLIEQGFDVELGYWVIDAISDGEPVQCYTRKVQLERRQTAGGEVLWWNARVTWE